MYDEKKITKNWTIAENKFLLKGHIFYCSQRTSFFAVNELQRQPTGAPETAACTSSSRLGAYTRARNCFDYQVLGLSDIQLQLRIIFHSGERESNRSRQYFYPEGKAIGPRIASAGYNTRLLINQCAYVWEIGSVMSDEGSRVICSVTGFYHLYLNFKKK